MKRKTAKIKTLADFLGYALKNDKSFRARLFHNLNNIIEESSMSEVTLMRALDMDIFRNGKLTRDESWIKWAILQNGKQGKRYWKKALQSENVDVRRAVFEDRVPHDILLQGLEDSHSKVRIEAARNGNMNEKLVLKALCDKDKRVRIAAIARWSSNDMPAAIAVAMKDTSADVRIAALQTADRWPRKKTARAATTVAVTDPSEKVRAWVAEHANALTESQWFTLLSDPCASVRKAARKNENAKKWNDPIRQLLRKAKEAEKKSEQKMAA